MVYRSIFFCTSFLSLKLKMILPLNLLFCRAEKFGMSRIVTMRSINIWHHKAYTYDVLPVMDVSYTHITQYLPWQSPLGTLFSRFDWLHDFTWGLRWGPLDPKCLRFPLISELRYAQTRIRFSFGLVGWMFPTTAAFLIIWWERKTFGRICGS